MSIHIFNGEDPERIPKAVDKINHELRILRASYFEMLNEAFNDEKGNEVFKIEKEEDRLEFKHLMCHVEYIHQFMAPLFINFDISVKDYNEYITQHDDFMDYLKVLSKFEIGFTLLLEEFFKRLDAFFGSIQNCFVKNNQSKKE